MKFTVLALLAASASSLLVAASPQGDLATPSELPTDAVVPPADVPADETAASTVTEAYVTAADAPAATSTLADAAITAQATEAAQPQTFGPVGKLNSPSEWTVIKSSPYGNGGIWIDYSPVASRDARTYGIRVALKSLDGYDFWDYDALFAVNPKSRKVNAYLSVNQGICGARELEIREVQRWKGETRTFLSTRRSVYINCDSGDQYANY